MHRHKCEECGTVWEHDSRTRTPAERDEAHQCPDCGAFQFWIYTGADPVTPIEAPF